MQWGGAHVWKVGGKVFAIGGWSDDDRLAVTFKVDPPTFDLLRQAPGCCAAPYLASRGMKWIQWTRPDAISSDELRKYIADSYDLVVAGLTIKVRRELGLIS